MVSIKDLVAVILTLLFVCGEAVTGQEPTPRPEPKTKLEAFQKQTGKVFIKGFSDVGQIHGTGSIEAICMEFTNATTKAKQTGIVIEVTEGGRLERTNRLFVDADEVTALLAGIDYVANVKADETKLSNFEATYRTKDDLAITSFSSVDGQIKTAVSSGDIGSAQAFISLDQLAELRALLFKAKVSLATL
jgi:hypothetical protein